MSEVLVMRPDDFVGFYAELGGSNSYEQTNTDRVYVSVSADQWASEPYDYIRPHRATCIRGLIQPSYNGRIIESVTFRFVSLYSYQTLTYTCRITTGDRDGIGVIGGPPSGPGGAYGQLNVWYGDRDDNCNTQQHYSSGRYWYTGTYTFVFDTPIELTANTQYYLWIYPASYPAFGGESSNIAHVPKDSSRYYYWDTAGATLNGTSWSTPMSVSVSASRYNDNSTVNNWGIYLQGYSKADISVTATGTNGSPITNYNVQIGSTQVWNGTSSSGRTGVISNSGTITITATVTDATGATGSATTTITVYPYQQPNLTNIQCYRCNSNGAANTSGTYLWASGTPVFSSANNHNSCTVSFKYGAAGGSMGSYNTINNPSTWQQIVSGLSATSSYNVMFKIVDALNNYREFSITIPTASVTMNFKDGGTGVCFGGYATKDNCFEIANAQGWKAVISNGMYGDTLPTSGNTEGQIFFKSIPSGTMDMGVITLASGITSPGWTQYWWRVGNQVTFELMGTNDTGATLSGSDILATGLPIPKFDNSGTRIQSSLIGLIVNSSNGRIGLGFRVAVDNDGTVHMTWAGWIENGDTFSIQGTYFAQ